MCIYIYIYMYYVHAGQLQDRVPGDPELRGAGRRGSGGGKPTPTPLINDSCSKTVSIGYITL